MVAYKNGNWYFCLILSNLFLFTITSKALYQEMYKTGFVYCVESIKNVLENYKDINSDKAPKILRKILTYIEKINEKYKEELYKLLKDIQLPFLEIYFSVEGKHGHYNIKRLIYNLRHLRESVGKILDIYA